MHADIGACYFGNSQEESAKEPQTTNKSNMRMSISIALILTVAYALKNLNRKNT